MAGAKVQPNARQVSDLLDSSEVGALVADLEATRWTGRPGYPLRAMVGMALVKSLYTLPTWTRTVRLVAEHAALQDALGAIPSIDACYRFTRKLRRHGDLLTACIERTLAALREYVPEFGTVVAIDGSDLPAYANGQRFVSRNGPERKTFSDPDASWGHRSSISTRKGGGYYGYKIHAAVCTSTGLPLAWRVETARDSELPLVPVLLDSLAGRGFVPGHAVLDKGYDARQVYEAVEVRGIRPVVPLRKDAAVKGEAQAADLCPRRVDLRRCRCQARRLEVALPDRRLHPGVGVDQGRPAAPPVPPSHQAVGRPLPQARIGRA